MSDKVSHIVVESEIDSRSKLVVKFVALMLYLLLLVIFTGDCKALSCPVFEKPDATDPAVFFKLGGEI